METRLKQSDLLQLLDNPQDFRQWLAGWGLTDFQLAHRNLVSMAEAGVTLDLLTPLCNRLAAELPHVSDPDMAMNNLERFVSHARSPLALASLFERDPEALPILLQIFSTSQFISDLLIAQPETYDLLRISEGQPVARDILVDDLVCELHATEDERLAAALVNGFKRREIARIAYGDVIGQQRLAVVTRQLSYLADAVCEATLRVTKAQLGERFGIPRTSSGLEARFAIIGLGKLGGNELNYSSDIDLVMFYDEEGQTNGDRRVSNQEFFERLVRKTVQLLSDTTESGSAYRVDLRLRPQGAQGASVISRAAARHYYDVFGRTWERQAFIKARPVAGDLDFATQLLADLEPWIYQQHLTRSDITEIKALKRKIESQAKRGGHDQTNVKVGHGGIRDIEFAIQFLQLLHGGDLPSVRTGNTQEAIERLEQAGCLTMQERSLLGGNYVFLRRIEHLLQIMFDTQTHTLPQSDVELRKLAIRMGYSPANKADALVRFKTDLAEKTRLNRSMLDHLLHDAFSEDEQIPAEVDLVLGPRADAAVIAATLSPFGFQDCIAAYNNLTALAAENIPFLNSRRCRHFFAAIVPTLLAEVAGTPRPDETLVNLSNVSDSLGGKAVLWELLSANPATLRLYVQLCSSSPYLSGLLTSNPGMIDELLDSLMLAKHPNIDELGRMLDELCRGAEDIEPILHSFKGTMHLRVGVRELLGKDDIETTTEMLSDVAEVCLQRIAQAEYDELVSRHGVPQKQLTADEPATEPSNTENDPCHFVILGVGKLGGREPNYQSDLDVVFLYEEEGHTRHIEAHRVSNETTTNQHFFSQLSKRIIKRVTHLGPYGRLYEMDPRLRPTGRSGSIAVSLAEFQRYFAQGSGQLWERQALCKARTVFGDSSAGQRVMGIVREVIVSANWNDETAESIRQTRYQMEATASKSNLKRGSGGTVDIEFLVQMLQLRYAQDHPEVMATGTMAAINALRDAKFLKPAEADYLIESYAFLRNVEARIRLMDMTTRHELPKSETELATLAYLLDYDDSQKLLAQVETYRTQNRRHFEACVDRLSRQLAG